MEPFTDAIGPRAVRFGLCVIDIFNRQIKLASMVLDLAAIFGSAIRQDAQQVDLVFRKERNDAVVEQVGAVIAVFSV